MSKPILFFIALFTICNSSLTSCKNCDPVRISYQETEDYIDKEPYDEQVEDRVQLTYEIVNPQFQFRRIGGLGFDPTFFAKISITNTSDQEGVFSLNATFVCDGKTATVFGQKTIASGATAELEGQVDVRPYTFENQNLNPRDCVLQDYKIIAPTVSALRVVTKYKDVTKTRIVQKERDCYPCKENCPNK